MAPTRQAPQFDRMGRFLVEHETCGEGFDIENPAGDGGGVVSLTCRGCGETFEYATATIEIEREIELERVEARATGDDEDPTDELELPALPPRSAAPPPPQPAGGAAAPPPSPHPPARPPAAGYRKPPRPPAPRRRERGLSRRERFLAGGLVAFAALALAFAVLRFAAGDEEEEPTPVRAAPEQRVAGVSAVGPAVAVADPDRARAQADREPASDPVTSPVPGSGERLVETDRFTIVVPDSWAEGEADGGLLLAPTGAAPASVQVFYEENPGLAVDEMVDETADFLRSRSAGGRVGPARRFTVDGYPAFELRKPGPLGAQTALGVLAGPLRYLVVAGENEGAPERDAAAAQRALGSFRPR